MKRYLASFILLFLLWIQLHGLTHSFENQATHPHDCTVCKTQLRTPATHLNQSNINLLKPIPLGFIKIAVQSNQSTSHQSKQESPRAPPFISFS